MKQRRIAVSRLTIISVLLVVIFALYAVRMMQLQLIEGAGFRQMSDVRYTRELTVKAARGEIVDRNGIPLAANRTGYNVVFDKSYIKMADVNEIILVVADIISKQNETYQQSIPITDTEPYAFKDGYENSVASLKARIGLQDYATFENVWNALCERYDVDEKLSAKQKRIIIASRYEMEIKGFTVSTPFTFSKDVSMSTVSEILEKSITYEGIGISEESIREYPDGTIAPHILGTIGPIYAEEYAELKSQGYGYNDYVGKSGIEKQYESYLRGTDGVKVIEFDVEGNVISSYMKIDPIPGNTIVLTIDSELQKTAQTVLEKRIKEIAATSPKGKGDEANAGCVVALNPQTGEIMTAANYPSYDITEYYSNYSELANNEQKPLFNRCFNGAYAPGSTFKPCMGVAAMCSGTINSSSTVGCYRVYDYLDMKFTCMGHHSKINLANALRVSCNIFFYDVGKRMGISTINNYASLLGLGEKTGLELPENKGRLASPEYRESQGRKWYPGDVLQASIGQSDSMFSPLQIAVYTGAIGNNGVRMEAHIVKKIVTYDYSKVVYEHKDKVLSTIENKNGAFEAVKEGMYLVSTKGTGRSAFGNYAFKVGSKTGSPENYGNKAANSVFTAIGPLDNCKLSVAAVVEYGFNGNKAAPIVKEIFDKHFFDKSESNAPTVENSLIS